MAEQARRASGFHKRTKGISHQHEAEAVVKNPAFNTNRTKGKAHTNPGTPAAPGKRPDGVPVKHAAGTAEAPRVAPAAVPPTNTPENNQGGDSAADTITGVRKTYTPKKGDRK